MSAAMTDVVQVILAKRGIVEPEAIARFLEPDYARDIYDPFLLQNMERAVVRILAAMERGERIALYADFDCDGIPGAALLHAHFTKIGYANFEVYIPHRDDEGHGVHEGALSALAARGVSLVITIDVGITAHAAVAHAKNLGLDVIITDHHEIVGTLPEAYAVVNPKLGDYPFRDLCGAGVAWKLACAILARGKARGLAQFADIPGWEKWLLDFVAIATVADLVPLVGENRALVHFGLKVLRKSPQLGIRALCAQARVQQGTLTEDDIAFTFAPRINAASRMESPELAFRLLTTSDQTEAESLAAHLESLNRKRKTTVGVLVREVNARVRARYAADAKVVVLGDTKWKPGLLGLAANSVMQDRGGVVCLWGRDGQGRLKGSCRSDGSLSVVDLFAHTGTALEEYGGHKASGGFSVSHEAVHHLSEEMERAAEHCLQATTVASEPDADVSLSAANESLFRDLSRLGPFGVGNPKPVFRISARVTFARQFGKEMNHTEVSFVCDESGATCRAFQYFKTPMDFTLPPEPGRAVSALATLERDAYRGGVTLRLIDLHHPRA